MLTGCYKQQPGLLTGTNEELELLLGKNTGWLLLCECPLAQARGIATPHDTAVATMPKKSATLRTVWWLPEATLLEVLVVWVTVVPILIVVGAKLIEG